MAKKDFADVIKSSNGEVILNNPGRPSVIVRVLIRGKWEGQSQRRGLDDRDSDAEPWPKECRKTLETGKSKEIDSAIDTLERTHLCQPILGFWPIELQDNKCMSFLWLKFMVTCYTSNKKLKHSGNCTPKRDSAISYLTLIAISVHQVSISLPCRHLK